MKTANIIRTLAATCAFAITAHASAAPILLVNDGILEGANGVNVGGTLYNVTFAVGSCDSLFNGCKTSAFAFTTLESASQAAIALLDQVFVDGPSGQFDSQMKTFGCSTLDSYCLSIVPYRGGNIARVVYALNSVNEDRDRYTASGFLSDFDTSIYGAEIFARFEVAPTVDVPEPSSLALMGLAMAGLAFNRRRKA